MERMFVVRSVEYRMESTSMACSTVERLGFSIVRLMPLSNGAATGVRADLKIDDQEALTELADHYSDNVDLYWTFDFGGGAQPTSAQLRFTKFDRPSGRIQLVRTAVLRDLIAEVDPSTASQGDGAPSSVSSPEAPTSRPASKKTSSRTSESPSLTGQIASLWPKIFG